MITHAWPALPPGPPVIPEASALENARSVPDAQAIARWLERELILPVELYERDLDDLNLLPDRRRRWRYQDALRVLEHAGWLLTAHVIGPRGGSWPSRYLINPNISRRTQATAA